MDGQPRPSDRHTMSVKTYVHTLIAIATESYRARDPSRPLEVPEIPDPSAFVADLFRTLVTDKIPITREGMERMLDTLAAAPIFANIWAHPPPPLDLDLENIPPAFQTIWTYIVCPAWKQIAELHEVIALTALTTDR